MTWRSVCPLLGIALATFFPLASLFAQPNKTPPLFVITGTVLNSRDNAPVRHCSISGHLVGTRQSASPDPKPAETDEHGRFSLSLPAPGNWELTATARNIRSQPLDSHDGFFTGVILTPRSPSYDVTFKVIPDALLTGFVTDEAGEAVRDAQVLLFTADATAPQSDNPALQQRQRAQTDDRGHFEMEGLDPGRYMLQVQARPWYASAAITQRSNGATSPSPPDPSLDVVYPSTWYPGVSDSSAAGILQAHAGDVLQADLRLLPQPSAHLLIPSSLQQIPQPVPGVEKTPPSIQNPNLSLLLPDGTLQQVFGQISRAPNGDLEISGLAPGTYQVSRAGSGPGASSRTSLVNVQSGSSATLNGIPAETSLTVAVDGRTNVGPSQIVLIDSSTGQSFSPGQHPGGNNRYPGFQGQGQRPDGPASRGGQDMPRGRPGNGSAPEFGSRGRSRTFGDGDAIIFQVPPGRYQVTVRNDSAAFVTGLVLSKGLAAGRSVTIPAGEVHLLVHLASGFAAVKGIASFAEKPSVGAMILLVPATLGDPASLTVVRRDQTNTDGSFSLENVIPGEYILLAIDHGWAVRWTDPAVLRPYLMQGTPLDLRTSKVVTPKLTALTP